jgi:hypothetical protein
MRSSLLNDLAVFEHRDAAALYEFAFERDGFAAGIGQLVVHRFVFADDEVGFAVFNDPDRSAVLDALGAAGRAVTIARRVMIDVAHHVDDLAGHGLFRTRVGFAVFMFGSEGERCRCKRSDDDH